MLLIPLILMILIWVWPFMWYKMVRGQLHVEVHILRTIVDIDEAIPVQIRIRNSSWIPCPNVKVFIHLPEGISSQLEVNHQHFEFRTYLFGKQELTVDAVIYGKKRGLHNFQSGNISMELSEGFGLMSFFAGAEVNQEVEVLPDFLKDGAMNISPREWIGKMEQRRWILPDESMFSGMRNYTAGDSFRHVAWKASAKKGDWMTKTFSGSTEWDVVLMINAQFFEPYWQGTQHDVFDELCSMVSTWAQLLENRGARLHLVTNAIMPNSPQKMWYGLQRASSIRVLLGRIHPYANRSFEQMAEAVKDHLKQNEVVLVFSAFSSEGALRALSSIARKGHPVYWLSDSNSAEANADFSEIQKIV